MIRKKGLEFSESREDKFMLPGIDFRAKLIGVETVGEARGDKMCLDAMIKLKYLVKAAGEHKQRIIVNVSIEGIRLLDERTREVLHQHEVHKISFISRDPTDARAFGYIHGEQGNHKFFGIKTEKQADNVVITLKELFEVILDLKKKQMEEQKKADGVTSVTLSNNEAEKTEPKQIASFKNPPPLESGDAAVPAGQPVPEGMYAEVNKPKLSELAANLNAEAAGSSGLLDLEQEVKNIQMGIDAMEGFDLHPQSPTSPQSADPFAAPADPFAPKAAPAPAPAPASDPFTLAGPPPVQKAAVAKSASLDATFGASDPFVVQTTPAALTNSAPPEPASTAPSADLFKEFSDTFTAPAQPPPVSAFQTPMMQSAPNPFGGMAPPMQAPAPFQANFGGMSAAPAAFGAPPPQQKPADPFGGDIFGESVLQPEAIPSAQAEQQPQKSDPFAGIGALSSAKGEGQSKSTKDMFAGYKIGKPGDPAPAPEIKLTGGPKRPPPAVPTGPASNPFAPGGAPVTNGANTSGGTDLFGNSFDTFDFSNPNQ